MQEMLLKRDILVPKIMLKLKLASSIEHKITFSHCCQNHLVCLGFPTSLQIFTLMRYIYYCNEILNALGASLLQQTAHFGYCSVERYVTKFYGLWKYNLHIWTHRHTRIAAYQRNSMSQIRHIPPGSMSRTPKYLCLFCGGGHCTCCLFWKTDRVTAGSPRTPRVPLFLDEFAKRRFLEVQLGRQEPI